MTAQDVLENSFNESKKLKIPKINKEVIKNVDILIKYIDSNKSLVSAIVTSLIKKILEPNQDIRKHRIDFENGYSARNLDTHFTTPFFKQHFPKYSNKETAFLTLATREKILWSLTEGKNLKIRNDDLKTAFLQILNFVQLENQNPKIWLNYISFKLFQLSKNDNKVFLSSSQNIERLGILNINIIISMLKEHFALKHSSRLPVIAVYSIYQELIKKFNTYNDKKLLPLNVHTSSDKHSFGDIEIYTNDDKPFEIIEIKHNIAIDRYMIFDILKKIENQQVTRYYILTTHQDNFISNEEENYVNELILKIKKEYNIEIIANGIINSLKYYLRFIENYKSFIDNYTNNLIEDAKLSTEVKVEHITKWNEILKCYSIN